MEVTCPECGNTYNMNKETVNCPECGFGPEQCNHPIEYREYGEPKRIYDAGENQYVENVICGKCGTRM